MAHKAGYVNIIGPPNVGKSTLMNQFLGQKVSITTKKPQTTRNRILGIYNDEECQIVFSDTPGLINPNYKLQEQMMKFVEKAWEDADILLWMVDAREDPEEVTGQKIWKKLKKRFQKLEVPLLFTLNKVDQLQKKDPHQLAEQWEEILSELLPDDLRHQVLPISALQNWNLDKVSNFLLQHLPENPPYYPKDQLSDRPVRFFVAELIREVIFRQFRQEIPYSTQVEIAAFEEEEGVVRIYPNIIVNKKSQKPILIGKGGQALARLTKEAQPLIEEFLQKPVYIEFTVKVRKNWRNKPDYLKNYGFQP